MRIWWGIEPGYAMTQGLDMVLLLLSSQAVMAASSKCKPGFVDPKNCATAMTWSLSSRAHARFLGVMMDTKSCQLSGFIVMITAT